MASSFLYLPNTHSLSDNVIGGVVQRVGSLHGRFGRSDGNDNREVGPYTTSRQYTMRQIDSSSTMNKSPTRGLIGHKRLPDLASFAELATRHTGVTTEEAQLTPPSAGKKMKVSATRRERCRINQARYRMRQRQHEDELDKHINQVQEGIQELNARRQNIIRCSPTNESVWVVATEYFRLFSYGFMTPLISPQTESTAAKQAQLDYLQANMALDVTNGNVCGTEALLENWKLLSLYHKDLHLQLKHLRQVGEDSILAIATTNVTITENTLRHLYPHLVDAGKRSPLAAKLLNQRLVMRGSVRFDWNASTGRMTRVESKFDTLTPVLELLGSLEDVAVVFDKALMTPEGRIVTKTG